MKTRAGIRTPKGGFTIVELLIVIVIIGILATLILHAVVREQEQARMTKVKHDLDELVKTVQMARTKQNKTLLEITNNTSTVSECQDFPDGTDLSQHNAQTASCWNAYETSLKKISDAAGVDITSLKDPYGRPYWIDENEGDPYIAYRCTEDAFQEFAMPYKGHWNAQGMTQGTLRTILPFSPSCGDIGGDITR